ncbi:MAG: sensor histidine kinase, partial [Spirochaetales bacterium]|nr:sensor histidine kinase [Spirochaetales bacterium]
MKAAAAVGLLLLFTSCTERVVPRLVQTPSDRAVIDLTAWNFEKDGPVRLLNNTWEFHWNRLCTPEDFRTGRASDPPVLTAGGRAWNGTLIDGQELTEEGCATYRTVIHLPGKGIYSLYMQNQDSAYRLWLNGEEAGGNGVVAETEEAYVPQRVPRTFQHYVAGKELEVLLQIANFTHKWGGLTNNIYIGLPDQIRAFVNRLYGIIAFLAGAILIMALYHLVLYLLRRQDRSSLFFAFFCFSVLLWYLFNGDYLFYRLFPDFPLGFGIRIHYSATGGMLPFFLLFIRSAYPDRKMNTPLWVLIVPGGALMLLPFFTPIPFCSSRILVPIYSLILLGAVAVFIVLFRALKQRRPGTVFSLAGFLVLMGTTVYDMLADRKIITGSPMGPFSPAGLFVFILMQSFILARQFASAYDRLDDLSTNLEEKVRLRTTELQKAREKLFQQEKLAALGTLVGGVSHEILNPLSGISGPLSVVRKELERSGLGTNETLDRHLTYMEENLKTVTASARNLDALMKEREVLKSSVPLRPLVEGIMAAYPQVCFQVLLPEGSEISGDPGMLRQILENLISNAAAALDDSGRIAVEYRTDPPPSVLLVRDTGRGMEPEQLS